jgi:hypothetical protein
LKRRDGFFRRHRALAEVRRVAAPLGTFHLVVVGLVFFHASSLGAALDYLKTFAAGLAGSAIPATRLDLHTLAIERKPLLAIGLLFVLTELVHVAGHKPRWVARFLNAPRIYRWGLYYTVILVTLALSRLGEEKFIYAQF